MQTRRLRAPSACLRAGAHVLALLVVICAPLDPARASGSFVPDGVEVTGGYGHDVTIYGVAVNWNPLCTCAGLKTLGLETRLVAQVAYWEGRQHPTANGSLWDTRLTPMLRWAGPEATSVRGFIEAGIGAHLLSATRINNDRVLSTAFQFGETAGAGIAFGDRHRYELGAYVQHVSNARLKEPNNGLTYFGAVVRVALP